MKRSSVRFGTARTGTGPPGPVELGTVLLAPLSGISDSPFRRICKRFGADAVYSEMVSSEGLTRGNRRTREIYRFSEEERPIGIQIVGRDPGRMAESARIVAEAGPDLVDLNLACPARKIVSRGSGCALMREPGRIARIARAVVDATALPVTGKIRIGWDEAAINALEVARTLEDAGVAAVTVHGRTWKQGFKGTSSWNEVARVKRGIGIPVVLSGDVTSPEAAERALEITGCDAIMVGRGVYGRPWIFREIHDYLGGGGSGSSGGHPGDGVSTGRIYRSAGPDEVRRTILDHLDLSIAEYGEETAVIRFRKHLLWYTKRMHGVVALRPVMSRIATRLEVTKLLDEIFGRRPDEVRDGGWGRDPDGV